MREEYRTVFEVSYLGSNGVVFSALLLCACVLVWTGLTIIARGVRRAETARHDPMSFAIFRRFVLGALALTALSLVWFASNLYHTHQVIRALRSAHCDVTEGEVHVLHREPWGGHDGGDVIHIAGKEFVFSFQDTRPGYHQTLAHSGLLYEGAFVRVHHLGNTILQIEIK